MEVNTGEDIKRTMNVFCGLTVISLFVSRGGFGNFFVQVILVIIPAMYILKVSPVKIIEGVKYPISLFGICNITILMWGLYRIIIYALVSIPWIAKIENTLELPEYSPLIVEILFFIVALTLEEVLYRGILLNKLRKHGDLFAVVISSIVFAIAHGARIYTIIAGLLVGVLYVISNSIIPPIALHALINLSAIYFESSVFESNRMIILFYLVICIICVALMLIDKGFRTTLIAMKSKYKEKVFIKEKYIAAFKSEGFLVFLMFSVLSAAMTFSVLFKMSRGS